MKRTFVSGMLGFFLGVTVMVAYQMMVQGGAGALPLRTQNMDKKLLLIPQEMSIEEGESWKVSVVPCHINRNQLSVVELHHTERIVSTPLRPNDSRYSSFDVRSKDWGDMKGSEELEFSFLFEGDSIPTFAYVDVIKDSIGRSLMFSIRGNN